MVVCGAAVPVYVPANFFLNLRAMAEGRSTNTHYVHITYVSSKSFVSVSQVQKCVYKSSQSTHVKGILDRCRPTSKARAMCVQQSYADTCVPLFLHRLRGRHFLTRLR